MIIAAGFLYLAGGVDEFRKGNLWDGVMLVFYFGANYCIAKRMGWEHF